MRRSLEAVIGAFLFLSLLACTGVLEDLGMSDEAGEEVDEAEDDDGEPKDRKGRKRRGNDPDPGDGDEGDDDGEDGGDGGGDAPGAAPSPTPSPSPSTAPAGIEQVNDTTWKIERKLLDKWLNRPDKNGNAKRKGKGYQLTSIKNGNDYWHAGLRNGDIIKEVNNYSLASDAEALLAFQALQSAKKLNVKMKRGEGPRNHTYLIE